jgi:hypothetical protein
MTKRPEEEDTTGTHHPLMLPGDPSSSTPTSDYQDRFVKEDSKAASLALAPTLDPQDSLALESARDMATRLALGDQDSKPQSLPPPAPRAQATITPRNPSSIRRLHHEDEAEKTELHRQSNIGVGFSRPGAFACRPPQETDYSGNTPAQPSEQDDEDEDSHTEILDASQFVEPEVVPISDLEQQSSNVISAHVVDEDEDIEVRLRAQFQQEGAEIANQTRTSLLKEAVEAHEVNIIEDDGNTRNRKHMLSCALIMFAVTALAVGLGIGVSGMSSPDDDTLRLENLEFAQDVYVTYTVSVLNGTLEEVPREAWYPNLILSMDLLAPAVLLELLSPEEKRQLPVKQVYTPVTIIFPTFIEGGTVIGKFEASLWRGAVSAPK